MPDTAKDVEVTGGMIMTLVVEPPGQLEQEAVTVVVPGIVTVDASAVGGVKISREGILVIVVASGVAVGSSKVVMIGTPDVGALITLVLMTTSVVPPGQVGQEAVIVTTGAGIVGLNTAGIVALVVASAIEVLSALVLWILVTISVVPPGQVEHEAVMVIVSGLIVVAASATGGLKMFGDGALVIVATSGTGLVVGITNVVVPPTQIGHGAVTVTISGAAAVVRLANGGPKLFGSGSLVMVATSGVEVVVLITNVVVPSGQIEHGAVTVTNSVIGLGALSTNTVVPPKQVEQGAVTVIGPTVGFIALMTNAVVSPAQLE